MLYLSGFESIFATTLEHSLMKAFIVSFDGFAFVTIFKFGIESNILKEIQVNFQVVSTWIYLFWRAF